LQAIGFPAAATEDGVRSVLNDIASRGHDEGIGLIVARPLPGCSVKIHLDKNSQPTNLSVFADAALQTALICGNGKGFTVIDSRPVHPFEAQLPSEVVPGLKICRSTFFAHSTDSELSARVVECRQATNSFTGKEVSTGQLWIPGMLIAFYGNVQAETGRDVTLRGTLVMEIVSSLSS